MVTNTNPNSIKLGVFTLVIMNITAVVSFKGLLEEAGYLSHFFQKANKNGIQSNILIVQALVVSALGIFFIASSFIGSILAFIICFIPPAQINLGSMAGWYTILILTCMIFIIIPFVIYTFKKKS